ncbi:hypothetical protein PVAP13_6NG101503 [Panicum virgatum]|uniref:Uncharacterized protein n=1 Tax=Panicum virgatum TaxID=38727 RepID=A0A8T0QW14_PANVG|nr:hypothetical protein PVAP13_6NG101503 [Panicum virgatum]KAG2577448.1 hypothetical protein PVAP13_6NG101503 [Panicum virgatum]
MNGVYLLMTSVHLFAFSNIRPVLEKLVHQISQVKLMLDRIPEEIHTFLKSENKFTLLRAPIPFTTQGLLLGSRPAYTTLFSPIDTNSRHVLHLYKVSTPFEYWCCLS